MTDYWIVKPLFDGKGYHIGNEIIKSMPSDAVVSIETVADIFGCEPCNFSFQGVDTNDFMFSECGDWCESNCESVPALECWKQFFKAWEERKDDE